MRNTQTPGPARNQRWGCLRGLPADGCTGEALVSFGAEQWLRLPMSSVDAARLQLKLGQRVGVDTSRTPMRLVLDSR